MTLVRLVARPMLSSMFIMGGINAIKNADALADQAQPVIDGLQPLIATAGSYLPIELDAKNVVRIDGLIHLVGGAMLAIGKAPRISSFVLAVSLAPTTLGGHRFWEEDDPSKKASQRTHFLKNVSLIGGLLVASVDTEGRPGLGWRARHGASLARQKAAEIAHI